MDAEATCDRLFATQHGVVARRQALNAGMTKHEIAWRLEKGRWKVAHPGVYISRSVPPSWHQRLMAAVLSGGPGALASHRSAMVPWRLDDSGPRPVEVSIGAGRRISGVTVHRRRDEPSSATVDGIPVTDVSRTLLDIVRVVPIEKVGLALDDALRRKLMKLEQMREALCSRGPRGRPGSRAIRRLIEDRDGRDAMAESLLEARLLRVLRMHHVPLPAPQHRVLNGTAVVARLDFAYPGQRLGIETDGFRWHGSPERWRRDLRRENRLKLLGWTLLRFSWDDVHERPEVVASQIRSALGSGEQQVLDSGR